MERTLRFLPILLMLSATGNCDCIDNLPEFRDQGKRSPALSMNKVQIVIPAYRMSCKGVITQWGLSTEKRGGHSIELQVWRETESNMYRKVGGNRFNQKPAKRQKLMYLTPHTNDSISVEPGDFIGLYALHTQGIKDNYKIQYESSSDVQMLYLPASSPQPDLVDPTQTSSQDIALLLHVEVSPYPPSSSTVPPQTNLNATPTASSSPPPTKAIGSQKQQDKTLLNAVIVSSIASVVVVMIVAVVVIAVLLLKYSHRHKRTPQTSSSGSCASGLDYTGGIETVSMVVTENPAYGQHKGSLAHDYELPSVNTTTHTSPIAIPHSRPPQPEPYYEIMARLEASSEYVPMKSLIKESEYVPMKSPIKESECCVDGSIYEELT